MGQSDSRFQTYSYKKGGVIFYIPFLTVNFTKNKVGFWYKYEYLSFL